MSNKLLIILILNLCFFNKLFSQCDKTIVPPVTLNGFDITSTSSGSVSRYPTAFTSCGNITTPTNSLYLGQNGSFSYTLNFSKPINNLVVYITATGQNENENFIFTTDSGIPNIIVIQSCYSVVNGNEIVSGKNAVSNGGGGIFEINNTKKYTSVTISGSGGQAGSLFSFCTNSFFNQNTYFNQNISLCEPDSLVVGNHIYKNSGTYLDTFKNSLNFDSFVTTNLVVNKKSLTSQKISICYGDTLKVGRHYYFENGIFIDTFKNYKNCDSIVYTELTIKTQSFNNQEIILCEGEQLKIANHVYTKTGLYTDTLLNYLGCDSILSTNLMFNRKTYASESYKICFGDTIKLYNKLYFTEGLFYDTLKNYQNCDSVVSIFIEFNDPVYKNLTFEICVGDTFYYQSTFYNQIGDYSDTFSQINGCDSIVNIKIQYFKNLTSCDDATVFVPNCFSPNKDQTNQVFKPVTTNVKNINLKIFNRWGEQLLDANGQDVFWDGTYKNEICIEGIYLYQIDIQGNNGKKYYFKGLFTLLN